MLSSYRVVQLLLLPKDSELLTLESIASLKPQTFVSCHRRPLCSSVVQHSSHTKAQVAQCKMANLDPTGLLGAGEGAVVSHLYNLGKTVLSDVINLERHGQKLKEGYLNDLLILTRDVVAQYDNASTPPYVLQMLKELYNILDDISRQISMQQSWNPIQRWAAAQKIKDAQEKLKQFGCKAAMLFQLLNGHDLTVINTQLKVNGQELAVVKTQLNTRLDVISTQMSTMAIQSSPIKFPASSSRFNILALPHCDNAPIGISKEMSKLSSWVLGEAGEHWICVSGMGGIGKSFLVRSVCSLPEVRQHFQNGIFWVRLGTMPQVLELQRDLCEEMSGRKARLLPSPEDGQTALCRLASEQRCLLVLDDAWMSPNSPSMACRSLLSLNFLDSNIGSKIIVTSRTQNILYNLGVDHRVLELHGLGGDDSYKLLCKHAFNVEEAPSDLEGCARHLATRCRGVAYVLEVVGKAMRSKRPEQWKRTLDKLSNGALDQHGQIMELLRVSYDNMSQVQQSRFLTLTLLLEAFPCNFVIGTELCLAWQSLDLLPVCNYKGAEIAIFEEAVEELVGYSLAYTLQDGYITQQEWMKELTMHVITEENQSHGQGVEAEGSRSGTGISFRVVLISKWVKATVVVPRLRLLAACHNKELQNNIESMQQLKFLYLDGHYDSVTASIGELTELVYLRLLISGMGNLQHHHNIDEALCKLTKMECLELITESKDLNLTFLKGMHKLRELRIDAGGGVAKSGFNIKYCHKLRNLDLRLHLADAHLNDLLHQKSSLEVADIRSMPCESTTGFKCVIPTTLKVFTVDSWTGDSPTCRSNFNKQMFRSSHQITKLSLCLAEESLPESLQCLHSLETLHLEGRGLLAILTPLNQLPQLQFLELKNCAMQRLSDLSFPLLHWLFIRACKSLVEIQNVSAPVLCRLKIEDCNSLIEVCGFYNSDNSPTIQPYQGWSKHPGFTTSSSSSQLQHNDAISYAHPFSKLRSLRICLAQESLPEWLGGLTALPQLKCFHLDGCGMLQHLPSLSKLPRLDSLVLKNCAMERLSLAEVAPPQLRTLEIRNFTNLVQIEGFSTATLTVTGCTSIAPSSSSPQLQHQGTISYASPFSNLKALQISMAWKSLPESFGCPQTLPQLKIFKLDGCGVLLHLPSFARLPKLSKLWLHNCAMQCLSLAAGPPGFPALGCLEISSLKCLVKIQGLYATRLHVLELRDCPSLEEIEIQDMHCPCLREFDQSDIGGVGYFADRLFQNRASTIYREG